MSLFAGAPNYAPIIWKQDQYPEENGITGFMEGMTSGLKTGAQYKADKKEYEDTGKGTKPNPFKYFFGAGQPVADATPNEDYQNLMQAIQDLADTIKGNSMSKGIGPFGGSLMK